MPESPIMTRRKRTPRSLPTASPECPLCGDIMYLRHGMRGPFWGCVRFPACRGTTATKASRAKG